MKKRLFLIGGGTIATHYKAGLASSPHFTLTALADINPNCPARKLFDVPFFTDYNEALKTGAEVALISTSTSSHYSIASELLNKGVDVVTEKPMCESYDKVVALATLAESKKVNLGCIFHWIYADEVRYLKQNLEQFGRIEKITVHIFDDYANTPDGSINSDRRGLCGAWLDSGINVLSYIGELVDMSDYTLQREEHDLDLLSNQEKYSRRIYCFGQTIADISVDWRTASREKYSEIICERGIVQVNHTRQTVTVNGKVVYEHPLADRLSGHYENVFAEFTLSREQLQRALLLHKILFDGGTQ